MTKETDLYINLNDIYPAGFPVDTLDSTKIDTVEFEEQLNLGESVGGGGRGDATYDQDLSDGNLLDDPDILESR